MRPAWRPAPAAARSPRLLLGLLGTLVVVLGPVATPGYTATGGSTDPAGAVAPAETIRAVPAVVEAARTEVHLSEISPAVALGGAPITVAGTLTNLGPGVLRRPPVTVRSATGALDSPAAVTAWSAGTTAAEGVVLGQARLAQDLAVGQSASFTVTVKGLAAGRTKTWGVVPVAVQAPGSAVHTYLAYQRVKEYEPVKVALGVPLTLPGDPALWSDGAARTAAWEEATGEDSAVAHVIAATALTRATWILDPLLLTEARVPARPSTPGGTPSGSPTTSGTPTGTPTDGATPTASPTDALSSLTTGNDAGHLSYAASEPEAVLRTSLAGTIRVLAAAHTPILLPAADPDLSVAALTATTRATMTAALARSRALGPALAGSADVAWPAGRWDGIAAAGVSAVYGSDAVAIVSGAELSSARPADSARQVDASGRPLIATTPELDSILSRTSSPHTGAVLGQELVARTAVFVGELPGTARTMAGVAPRGLDPDQSSLATVLDTMASIPWVQSVSLSSLTTSPVVPRNDVSKRATSAPRVPASPLTTATAQRRDAATALVASAGEVRADGPAWSGRWGQAGQLLLSSAWRQNREGFSTLLGGLDKAGAEVGQGVHPEAKTVNFLADSGRLQIVVVNTLDVAVSRLRLRFEPGSPILRVTDGQSAPLTIDAGSRATVTLKADALAAGTVPVTATLVAPDGTVLGSSTPLTLRVTPTGDWIYWVLGAAAALLVLAGGWRGRRRRVVRTEPDGS